MKVLLAFDSFKGSLSAQEVCEAAAIGIKSVDPDSIVEILPVADGGEGSLQTITQALGGEYVELRVTGPLGLPVNARYGICGRIAVVEMASASGLTLIPENLRNPWFTTSRGTGELILDALNRGCRRFVICIGGSATNDAGVGMLQALGFSFMDENGIEVGYGGGEIGRIASIDFSSVHPALDQAEFTVACDVDNPLTGPSGASVVFGPQKGADPDMVIKLDSSLEAFAGIVARMLGYDFSDRPGSGAAGGLGFALMTFLGARILPGIDVVLDTIGFDRRLDGISLVFTGEGCLDRQTLRGKAPFGVMRRASERGIPVIAVGGTVESDCVPMLIEAGFSAVFPIVPGPVTLNEALNTEESRRNIERTISQIIRVVLMNRI